MRKRQILGSHWEPSGRPNATKSRPSRAERHPKVSPCPAPGAQQWFFVPVRTSGRRLCSDWLVFLAIGVFFGVVCVRLCLIFGVVPGPLGERFFNRPLPQRRPASFFGAVPVPFPLGPPGESTLARSPGLRHLVADTLWVHTHHKHTLNNLPYGGRPKAALT